MSQTATTQQKNQQHSQKNMTDMSAEREKRGERGKRERDAFTLPDLAQVRGKGEVRKEEKGGAKAV